MWAMHFESAGTVTDLSDSDGEGQAAVSALEQPAAVSALEHPVKAEPVATDEAPKVSEQDSMHRVFENIFGMEPKVEGDWDLSLTAADMDKKISQEFKKHCSETADTPDEDSPDSLDPLKARPKQNLST